MNKKTVFLVLIAIIAALSTVFLLNKITNQRTSKIDKPPLLRPTPSTKEYQDPSGFLFSYPEWASVSANTKLDEDTYADIEIKETKSTATESARLLAVSSTLTSIETYSGDRVLLGTLEGKQFEKGENRVTVALDQGVLFTFTVPYGTKQKEKWESLRKTVLESFTFAEIDPGESLNTLEESEVGTYADPEPVIEFEGEEEVL